MRARG